MQKSTLFHKLKSEILAYHHNAQERYNESEYCEYFNEHRHSHGMAHLLILFAHKIYAADCDRALHDCGPEPYKRDRQAKHEISESRLFCEHNSASHNARLNKYHKAYNETV